MVTLPQFVTTLVQSNASIFIDYTSGTGNKPFNSVTEKIPEYLWHGASTDRRTPLLARFRAQQDPDDKGKVVGSGGGGHGRGPASGSQQEGLGQWDADEQNDYENILLLGGRV